MVLFAVIMIVGFTDHPRCGHKESPYLYRVAFECRRKDEVLLAIDDF
jgi:hypothetical protein